MSDTEQAVVLEFLRPIMNYFIHRDEVVAVDQSKKCRFWRDGMLKQLEEISDGKATPQTFIQLKKNLDDTSDEVEEAIQKMLTARNRIGGGRVAEQIDAVVNSADYGKPFIRMMINEIVKGGDTGASSATALEVCGKIRVLNAELDRLYRLVYV